MDNPTVVEEVKTIEPLLFQVPPRLSLAPARTTGVPPLIEIFSNLPSLKNPIQFSQL